VYSVSVTTGREFHAGAPRALFGERYNAFFLTNWDVAPNGKDFVFIRPQNALMGGLQINLLLHWFDHMRADPHAAAR
jgi:hypothetical protein